MRGRSRLRFRSLRSEGAILPADLLERLTGAQGGLDGLTPESYHLAEGEKLNEAINRAWQRLLPAWRSFREARAKLAESDAGTSLTREKWLLPLFQELGYGRLPAAKAVEIAGKAYPVSHGWSHVPIHLVGCGVDLDRRTRGVAGAARESPHSLVQELLNRSEERLWGFVSNGLSLRILRDSSALTRQAYLEFDLEALFDGEEFADFILLWLLAHPSRLEAADAHETWLERWSSEARTRGERALERLRRGVEEAIVALGAGFLSHARNSGLREHLEKGSVTKEDYYRALLRLVYRLIFLFVAEDRELLLDPAASPEVCRRYEHYSAARLRELAGRLRGSRHVDLWRALKLVMQRLGDEAGCPELGLKGLGSFLWSAEAVGALGDADIENRHLLDAVRALAWSADGGTRRPVDYKNLGSQELGSVYESLLELHPEIHASAGTFVLETASGHERKTTGSYYTPESLIQCLLDSALDPVLEETAQKPDAEKAILALKVCDPACGSGHFLVAAAHRIAKRLACVRTGDDEPAPAEMRHALRDVIGHCLYGVDLNEMAVELCKVSLWMEALEPGKPLSFLDGRIVCGNSLLGATPALMDKGIPEEALEPIEGDERSFATELKRAARKFDPKQVEIPLPTVSPMPHDALSAAVASIDLVDDSTLAAVRMKEERFRTLRESALSRPPNPWPRIGMKQV